MKLNKMKKEDLELMSYRQIAHAYLEENKVTMTTAELFTEVCKLLELSEKEYQDRIVDFFETLTTSKEFILLNTGKWDLRTNHTIKVDIEEIYEEKDDDLTVFELEEDEEDENKSYDLTDESDYNEELGDLSIVTEDELNDEE